MIKAVLANVHGARKKRELRLTGSGCYDGPAQCSRKSPAT